MSFKLASLGSNCSFQGKQLLLARGSSAGKFKFKFRVFLLSASASHNPLRGINKNRKGAKYSWIKEQSLIFWDEIHELLVTILTYTLVLKEVLSVFISYPFFF